MLNKFNYSDTEFILPPGLVGQFAVVNLWPTAKSAEFEFIERLKIAAFALNLKCVEIFSDGRFVDEPERVIKKQDVDFVLHLHFCTPKLYDAFSFVTLWNPEQFYHTCYYYYSRNLLSHDDFLRCGSEDADRHIKRLIRKSQTHQAPYFNLYPSIFDVIYPPSLGKQKLFYCGINWERSRSFKGRHAELFEHLDGLDILKIYGPRGKGGGAWSGFISYVDEIPFDGISTIDIIASLGISLVLSSDAHKKSELMSNRLFESIAAGALVICDENYFAKKYFGETLLYIDTRGSIEGTVGSILDHLDWARKNPEEVLKKIADAQEIFRQKFSLKKNIQDLYLGFSERKQKLVSNFNNVGISVNLYLLMHKYSEDVLQLHINNVLSQEYLSFSPFLVIDSGESIENKEKIHALLKKLSRTIRLIEVEFYDHSFNQGTLERNLGEVMYHILTKKVHQSDAFVFVAPNEKIFSNHIQVLAGSLIRDPSIACAATAVIIKTLDEQLLGSYDRVDFNSFYSKNKLIGYGRFIFRVSMLAEDLEIALPDVNIKTMAILVGENQIHQEYPATLIIDSNNPFPEDILTEKYENAIIDSFLHIGFNVMLDNENRFFLNSFFAGLKVKKKSYKIIREIKRIIKTPQKLGNKMKTLFLDT